MISAGSVLGIGEYKEYVVATEKPEQVDFTVEKNEDKAILTIVSEETREGVEFIIHISEDGENFEELIISAKDVHEITELELGKEYFFKVGIRLAYEEEYIYGEHSEIASVTLDKPVKVITPVAEEASANGFEGFVDHNHSSSEKWESEVERQLKNHGVYTEERRDVILNIIHHESTGREDAVNPVGGYTGLVQFGDHWKHDYPESYFIAHDIPGEYQADNRLSGNWSIHRLVHVIVDGGDSAIKRHWAGTWNK